MPCCVWLTGHQIIWWVMFHVLLVVLFYVRRFNQTMRETQPTGNKTASFNILNTIFPMQHTMKKVHKWWSHARDTICLYLNRCVDMCFIKRLCPCHKHVTQTYVSRACLLELSVFSVRFWLKIWPKKSDHMLKTCWHTLSFLSSLLQYRNARCRFHLCFLGVLLPVCWK